jgi:type I restriction enzyme S subunit
MSEVKNIPNGWEETTLGEVADIGSSKRIFFSDYVSEGIPFYRSKEIIEKQKGNNISLDLFITEERFNEIDSQFGSPKENDILLTSVGTIGIPYIVKENEKFYFKDGNLTWFKNYKKIHPLFLYHWLLSSIGIESLKQITIGSTQSALTISGLRNIPILLPSIEEQKSIAQILTAFDEKIELLQAQNKTLEVTAQTIFVEWFGKYSIDEELPEGWNVEKLGNEFDITIGRTPPRIEQEWFSDTPTGKKWISIKDIGNSGTYIFNTSEYLTDEAIKKFNIPIIPENTTILSFKMTVGKLTITTEDMLSNEAIAHLKLKVDTALSTEFIYLYLQNLDFNALGSTSSIVTAINSTMIKAIEVIIPKKDILIKFDDAIKPLFNKIKLNTEQINSLTQTRDELMPRLVCGEVRVKI